MVFEGLVGHKLPYKERDLIVKLILRNGMMGSFYVYGGQGGGKSNRPTLFELGSLVRIQIKDSRAGRAETSELMIASETQRLWSAQHVRYNIQSFYLVCLYFEILQKFAISFQLGQSENQGTEYEGIFSVISNALFYLDESLAKNNFHAHQHLTLFMIKLLYHIGIMPNTDECSFCGVDLIESESVSFLSAEGVFGCNQCTQAENDKGLLWRLKKGYQTRFQDYSELTDTNFTEADRLIQFFCHHFHLRPVELRSYSLLMR
jgi:recombinational DNA repair protein (RecF pathway)